MHRSLLSDGPLVSVVVIFRDAERFLDDAIASIFSQTYSNWELLLVDDGSADTSSSGARRWAEPHPDRVRYLEHRDHVNLGMSASRNLGIRHARGVYLAFLDADDVWLPDALLEQVALLEATPAAALVYGPIQWWYSWTGRPEDQARDFVESLGVPADTLVQPPDLLPRFLRNRAAVPSGMLVRREAAQRVRGFEDAFRGEYEDQVFCAKMCLNFPVLASGRCWYRYRQHPDSCVSRGLQTGRTKAARLCFLNWLVAYLASNEIRQPHVCRAVRFELWRLRHPTQYRLLVRAQHFLLRITDRMAVKTRRLSGGAP
jgi:glycosyltransferase involved in cell wall biosynthesis